MVTEFQPYVGPRPFERNEADQNRFFGRDDEAADLLSRITAHAAVLLYSQSGAGKTSLLNAKLIPLLEKSGFEVLRPARVRDVLPDENGVRELSNIYTFNVLRCWDEGRTSAALLAQMSIPEFLTNNRKTVSDQEDETPRVAIFDQFEELFISYQERSEDREKFLEQVGEALEQDRLLRVLFAMREDYIAELDPYLSLLPEKLRTRFRLERLSEEDALLAITEPLKYTECSYAPGVAEQLVEDLLIVPVETAKGVAKVRGESVEPVQLQVTCQTLWENCQSAWRGLKPSDKKIITREQLETFGDVDQALSRFYESAIKRVVQASSIKEGVLRRWFERSLITSVGTRGTVFRGKTETGRIPNVAVDELVNHHIIRGELRGGSRWYELTHDRLIEPIKSSNERWFLAHSGNEQTPKRLEARAERWIRDGRKTEDLLDDAELLEASRWLESPSADEVGYSNALLALVQASRSASEEAKREREHALATEQQGRAEAERQRAEEKQKRIEEQTKANRRLRWALAAVLVMFLVASGIAVYANSQRRQAEAFASYADSQRHEAQASAEAAMQAESRATASKQDALRARNEATEKRDEAERAQKEAEAARQRANLQANLANTRRIEAERAKSEADAARLEAVNQNAELAIAKTKAEEAQKQAENYLRLEKFDTSVFKFGFGYLPAKEIEALRAEIENNYQTVRELYSDNPAGEERMLNNVALAFEKAGPAAKALTYYENLLEAQKNAEDKEIDTLKRISQLYFPPGTPERKKVSDLLDHALESKEVNDNKEGQKLVLDILMDRDRYVNKTSYLKYAEKQLPLLTTFDEKVNLRNQMCMIQEELNNYESAIDCYEKFKADLPTSGDDAQKARTLQTRMLQTLGDIHLRLGQKEQAIQDYKKAQELFQKDSRDVAGVLMKMAAVYTSYEGNQYYRDLAIESYASAVAIFRKPSSRDFVGLLSALSSLAKLSEASGDKQTALGCYEEIWKLNKGVGAKIGQVRALHDLARFFKDNKQTEKALTSLHDAEQLLGPSGDERLRAITFYNLGKIHEDKNEEKEKRIALDYYNQALPLYVLIRDRRGEATTRNSLGSVYDYLKDRPQALKFYEDAANILHGIGDFVGEASVLNNIGHLFEKLGNADKAAMYFSKAKNLLLRK